MPSDFLTSADTPSTLNTRLLVAPRACPIMFSAHSTSKRALTHGKSTIPRCVVSVHPRTCRRQLHMTSFGEVVAWTAENMSTVHSAGVPWYLTIPLVAVGVNISVRLPTQYYARKLQAKRKELNPLGTVWLGRHAMKTPAVSPTQADSRLRNLRLSSATQKSLSRIYKSWGVQRWKSFIPLVSTIPFIIVSESIRRLCRSPASWISNTEATEAVDKITGAAARVVDPSLAEGGLLWFTDLTVSDPYFALPLMCSALLARLTASRMSIEQLKELFSNNSQTSQAPISRIQKVFGRLLVAMPVVPLMFSHLPSGIFLYWLSSFALQNFNEYFLTKLIPSSKTQLKTVPPTPPPALPFLSRTTKIKTK